MKWTKTHAVMVGVVIAGAAAISILQYRSQIRLSGQNDRLHQQAGQLAQLTTENQRLSNSVAQAHNSEATASNQSNGLLRQQIQEQPSVKSRNLSQPDVSPTPSISTKPEVAELSKDSWTNSGFATPQATLKTRGWAVLNGDRGQFAQSVFLTDGARKMIEDQLVQMASTSKDPDTPRLLGQAVSEKWGAEEAVLMPMMALNQNNAYTGYKILSQQSPSSDEMILNVETDMASALATTETLKFHRFGNDWRIVIDEAAVQKEMRQ